MNLLVGEAEGGFSVEDQVQLLLPARALVVFVDQCLIGTARHEEVDTERVDAERVLKWIPGGIVRVAVGDRRYRGDPLHRPTRHPRSLGRACGSSSGDIAERWRRRALLRHGCLVRCGWIAASEDGLPESSPVWNRTQRQLHPRLLPTGRLAG